MIESTWNPTRNGPPDPHATEYAGRLAGLRQCWEREGGGVSVVAEFADGVQARGLLEARTEMMDGGHYRLLGRWDCHPRWGWQFRFDACIPDLPSDEVGVSAYLERFAEGVGPKTAAKLIERYGKDAVAILSANCEQIAEDGVMGLDSARIAQASLLSVCGSPAMRQAHVDLFALLKGHGFWSKCIKAALRRWRERAAEIVRRDPFLMLTSGLPGVGFVKCDRLYLQLGRSPRRLKRQALAAWHALACADGDTWIQARAALESVRAQIGGSAPREKRAVAMLCRGRLAECRTDAQGRVWIADRYKAVSERQCALHLHRLMSSPHDWPDADSLGLNPETDRHQIEEIRNALTGPVALLTGTPGTGKTHCAAAIIRALVHRVGREKVAVYAPTGKAAVRITEKLQEAGLPLKATTAHKLLTVRPTDTGDGFAFENGPDNPLPFCYLIGDEVSMKDVGLAAAVLGACGTGTHLLLVGDPYQLPPVGHGAFLRDVIASKLPRAELTEIRRNAGLIVRACAAIKDGRVPTIPTSLSAWHADGGGDNLVRLAIGKAPGLIERQRLLRERLDAALDWVQQQGRWDLIDSVQIITARNATRQALNTHLQARLNAAGQKGPFGQYRQGDKVICLKNGFAIRADDRGGKQEYVANGDIGRVRDFRDRNMVVELASPKRLVLVPLTRKAEEDHRAVMDGDSPPGSWDLAYAVTCHKYQGSEIPVAIVLVEAAGKLGSREWIYTAISRAKDLCLLLADEQDLARYVRNVTLPDRKTFLRELIMGELK